MKKDVIIIGAGPAGLMAALKLAEQGIKPLVIEMKNSMDLLNRACSMQFIIDDDYEAEVLKIEGQKLVFTKCGLEVPYTGELVPIYNKYYHSPGDHVIRFARNDGKEPFSYKFDKLNLLKSLYDACTEKGVEFMMGTVALGGKDKGKGNGVELTVKRSGEKLSLNCEKLIIAEGVNAMVCGRFGVNRYRQEQGPEKAFDISMAYTVKYIMEGITGVENNSWNLYYGDAYHSKTACIIGPSLKGDGILEVTITGTEDQMPEKIFEEFTTLSPMAKHFRNARLIKKNGCGISAFNPVKEPCHENIIAIGDCAAMIEVETQGGLLCGYYAAKAVMDELEGKKGFEAYTKWWQDSFEFNGDDYQEVSKGYSLTYVYNDDELDYLFSLCEGHVLHGTYSQYLTPKLIWNCIRLSSEKIKAERPEIYAKMQQMGQA